MTVRLRGLDDSVRHPATLAHEPAEDVEFAGSGLAERIGNRLGFALVRRPLRAPRWPLPVFEDQTSAS